jgi:hypothetical protein
MSNPATGKDPQQPKAEHGASSEVTWDDGKGHEPYGNQGAEQNEEPHGGDEFAEGDRGAASGRNLEQLEAVKRKP